jgi:hypothetical protein
MKHISDLFQRYKNTLKPPQSSVIKEFIVVCEKITQHPLTPEQCEYLLNTRTIYLRVPSVLKSEILQQKPQLLTALKQQLQQHAPQDIR